MDGRGGLLRRFKNDESSWYVFLVGGGMACMF